MMISAQSIACPECAKAGRRVRAERVGAQDGCDIYVCEAKETHLLRIRVGDPREAWKEEP